MTVHSKSSSLWWFTSVVFPLVAGTFGPIANLFSVCGLVQTWRVTKPSGSRVRDPGWLGVFKHETDDTPRVVALNIISLVLALLANLFLLFNFAKRIPYRVAQPFTITFWFVSSLILLSLICSIQISTPGISPAYYSSSRSLLPIQHFFANLLHMHSHKVITTPL